MLFQVVRYEPKDFRQRRPDPKRRGKWMWSTKNVRQVPYQLPKLRDADDRVIFVVEGEKDADRLWKLGVVATCNAGGAGKWHADLSKFFDGRDVVIIPDRDPQKKHPKTGEPMCHPDGSPILPGQDHARRVAQELRGVAARVRVLELWRHWPEMPWKGDVSDWIAHGGTAAALYALIEQTPDWASPDEHGTSEPTEPDEEEQSEIDIEIARLAKLSLIKYEFERKAAAEALGCRASVIDRMVQGERARLGCDDGGGLQGRAISFPDPEPWSEPVDGAALLDDIAKVIGTHVIMPDASPTPAHFGPRIPS